MAATGERFGVSFLAWCLMSDHVHLIAVPEKPESLARAIGEAHRLYTRHVNAGEGAVGLLFHGRFHSCPLDERHAAAAARYVERNPVRAAIVKRAWDYAWSSASFHVGLRADDALVKDRDLTDLAGDWKELLRSEPEEADFVRARTRTGRPCGDEDFVAEAERLTGRALAPGRPGRPRKQGKRR